jgi:glycine oxidase
VRHKVDYIIVGQGLAGSCLAMQLLMAAKKIVVIDKTHANVATRIAAGLFNPITGKKFSKTWLADELFPYLLTFYREVEHLTQATFFHVMPLYRPFISVEEQNEWMGKSVEPGYKNFIEQTYTHPFLSEQVKNSLGGILVKQCGFVDTAKFLSSVKKYILQHAIYKEEEFDHQKLRVDEHGVEYEGIQSAKIIFCEGERARHTNFFSWLPIKPLKGETLSIKTPENVSVIFNRGVYVVPNIWKVGATYEFHDLSAGITAKGQQELLAKLKELINFPFTVIHQEWGFRPTTPDRRPIIGAHPEYRHIAIFNGLGTKGVSLAPYFSKVMLNWLENDTPINKEVDIQRYKSYYYAGNPLR